MQNVLKCERRVIYEPGSMVTQIEGNASSKPIKVMTISENGVCVVKFRVFAAPRVLDKVLLPMVWFSAHFGADWVFK